MDDKKFYTTKRLMLILIIWIVIFYFISDPFLGKYSSKNIISSLTKKQVSSEVKTLAHSSSSSSSSSSVPSKPARVIVDFFSSEPEALEQNDDYTLPDFEDLKSKMLAEQLIKDLPKDANLRIGFMRYVNGYRKWDKLYYVSKNVIQEKNVKGDIDIWMDTRFIFDILNEGFCPVMERENKNRNIGMNVNLAETKLFFKYAGLLKYKSCLGI